MKTEVEVKAPYNRTKKEIEELGAEYVDKILQTDIYYQHPSRDFTQTDEALRIRIQSDGFYLTYKGPKLDETTKTRMEYETQVPGDLHVILEELGFQEAGKVVKERTIYRLQEIEILVDNVEGLGSYIEVETDKEEEKPKLFKILEKLGIKPQETIRESYLELLAASTQK